ncbi:MAG: MFS transporter, partial [Henriciella sp.]|nr:MFS transporter [Henriciella sp.]
MAVADRLPAISENSLLRFFFVFAIYVAQGVPVGLFFYAIPAWLAMSGASALVVGGYVGVTALPWTLKFINGFIMDRFTFMPMGKRRAWLASAQIAIVIGLVACALANPSIEEVALLSAFSFTINAATTFQDVAVDGMAVDLVPDNERARANGLMFGGQSLGIALGTAGCGLLIAIYGLAVALLAVAGFVLLILTMILVLRERPGERLLPWTKGQASASSRAQKIDAWAPIFTSVWRSMTKRDSLLLVVALLMAGMAFGFYLAVAPLIAINQGSWTDASFSSLSGLASLTSGLFGIVVFGILIDRIGTRKAAIFGYLIFLVIGALMATGQGYWINRWVIVGFAFAYMLTDIYLKVANCA